MRLAAYYSARLFHHVSFETVHVWFRYRSLSGKRRTAISRSILYVQPSNFQEMRTMIWGIEYAVPADYLIGGLHSKLMPNPVKTEKKSVTVQNTKNTHKTYA